MARLSVTMKVQKDYPEFADEVAGMSIEQLDDRLAALAKSYEDVVEAKDDDEKLQDARELVKELSGPYRDSLKAIRLKNSFLVQLIKDKGGK